MLVCVRPSGGFQSGEVPACSQPAGGSATHTPAPAPCPTRLACRTAPPLLSWCSSWPTSCGRRCPPVPPPAPSTCWASRLAGYWRWRSPQVCMAARLLVRPAYGKPCKLAPAALPAMPAAAAADPALHVFVCVPQRCLPWWTAWCWSTRPLPLAAPCGPWLAPCCPRCACHPCLRACVCACVFVVARAHASCPRQPAQLSQLG